MNNEVVGIADNITNGYIGVYTDITNIANAFRLESDFKEDEQRKTDYHGRELLELLQNVDDAASSAGITDAEVSIEFIDNVFTIENSGTTFSEETIRRLCHGSASNKNDDYIGNKGTGFRSLLNWGRQIEIHSGDFHIGFSGEYAYKKFKEISEEEVIKSQIKNTPNLSIPILHCPFLAESIQNEHTTVKIITTDELQGDEQDILHQIENFDYRSLLFLPSITRIRIHTEEFDKTFEKINSSKNMVELSVNDEKEKYLVYHNKDEPKIDTGREQRKIKTSVAIPLNSENDFDSLNMFCFFPVRNFKTPIKCLMHASFELNASRDDIPTSDLNKKVFANLLEFVADVAEEKLTKNTNRQLALNSLTIADNNSKLFDAQSFNLEKHYYEILSKKRFLPTVNKKFVSIEDRPKLFVSDFPKSLCGDVFSNLLELLKNPENDEFVKKLAGFSVVDLDYSTQELRKLINGLIDKWNTVQRVEVFIWWEENYSDENILPELLLDMDGNYIEINGDIYFVRGRELDIPKWAKVKQLDRAYQGELFDRLKSIDTFKNDQKEEKIFERIVARRSGKSQYMPHVKFHDADASTILSPVNSSANTFEKAKEFLLWLFKNYNDLEWKVPDDINLHLPNSENSVNDAKNLYISDDFSNKLFSHTKLKPVLGGKELGLPDEENDEFSDFLLRLGVNKFPPITKAEIDDEEFWKLEGSQRSERDSHEIDCIKLLSEILLNNNENIILRWLYNDENLKLQFSPNRSFGSRNWYYYSKKSANVYKSYIKYVFGNTAWINIADEKYCPRECIFDYRGLDIGSVLPAITDSQIKDLSKETGISQKDIKQLLLDVGVKEFITELDSDNFYKCLMALPESDQSGQISEKIYRELSYLDECDYSNPPETLLLWTYNHNGKSYHEASDTYFSNSAQINIGNRHILKTPLRDGNFKTFNRVFGVQKFAENYEVDEDSVKPHKDNDVLQHNFADFKKYAAAWGEKNANIKNRLVGVTVELVSSCDLVEDGIVKPCHRNYMLIEHGRKWLIFVNENVDIDNRELSKCIEELFSQVANTSSETLPNELGELFRDKDGRKFLVEKKFGSVDVIDQISENAIRRNFADTLQLDYESEELFDIDFIQFDSLDNARPIIKILEAKNLDIDVFKVEGFEYPINLIPYWKKAAKDFIDEKSDEYKTKLYCYLLDKPDKQKEFLNEFELFRNYIPAVDDLSNSIHFNYKELVEQKFPILITLSEKIDLDEIYNTNFIKFNDNSDEFADFISGNLKIRSMIYFLTDKYKKKIISKYNSLNERPVEEYTNFASSKADAVLARKTITPTPPKITEHHIQNGGTTKTQTKINKENLNKSNRGKKAEEIAYEKLKMEYKSLRWTSEKSTIPAERNMSSVYDMEYIKDGKRFYVEIKASKGEFFMSSLEYSFAKKNCKNYELYFVDIENAEVDGPHSISEFNNVPLRPTEYKFTYRVNNNPDEMGVHNDE
jgi:hypothetical protein